MLRAACLTGAYPHNPLILPLPRREGELQDKDAGGQGFACFQQAGVFARLAGPGIRKQGLPGDGKDSRPGLFPVRLVIGKIQPDFIAERIWVNFQLYLLIGEGEIVFLRFQPAGTIVQQVDKGSIFKRIWQPRALQTVFRGGAGKICL